MRKATILAVRFYDRMGCIYKIQLQTRFYKVFNGIEVIRVNINLQFA